MMLRGLLILALFLPGSRAALATTNGNNSDTVAGGRQLAETSHMLASVETSRLKQMLMMQVPLSGSQSADAEFESVVLLYENLLY